jgi:cysteine desulfurase
MTNKLIYLDHAAATPLDKSVLQKMLSYFSDNFFNPSASYLPAKKVKQALSSAREKVAYYLGAKPSEVIFMAGATEANNLAIKGVMEAFPDSHMLYSAIEHESVIQPAKLYDSSEIAVKADGRLDLVDLKQKIKDNTVLISVIYASNEIGTIEPIGEISKVIENVKNNRLKSGNSLPLYFHSDVTQAVNYLDIHASRLKLDLMSLNGGKIYGPKQSGALFIKTGVKLNPQNLGGGQERGLRSGTENVAGDIGFASALELVQSSRHEESKRLQELSQKLISGLASSKNIELNGSTRYRLPNNVHITVHGKDNERFLLELENKGILAAAGSACSASNDEPSHVLKAIAKSDEEAQSSIRLTLGRVTSVSDIDKAIEIINLLASA